MGGFAFGKGRFLLHGVRNSCYSDTWTQTLIRNYQAEQGEGKGGEVSDGLACFKSHTACKSGLLSALTLSYANRHC